MAKKSDPVVGAPSLTPQRAVVRLEQRIKELLAFDVSQVQERWSADVKALQASVDDTLSNAFGHNSVEYNRYSAATLLDNGGIWVGQQPSLFQVHNWLNSGRDRAVKLLEQAVKGLRERIEDEEAAVASPGQGYELADVQINPNSIFLVHGHDEGAREAVARFLEKLGLQPIILHEKANQGRTIIEKIEAHSDVGFAVVLLTPDDFGGKKGDMPAPRARQNVILELGYFVGLLGRDRVCALKRGEVETPSDWDGVVYTAFDDNGGWKQALARELQQADYAVDWNKVMK